MLNAANVTCCDGHPYSFGQLKPYLEEIPPSHSEYVNVAWPLAALANRRTCWSRLMVWPLFLLSYDSTSCDTRSTWIILIIALQKRAISILLVKITKQQHTYHLKWCFCIQTGPVLKKPCLWWCYMARLRFNFCSRRFSELDKTVRHLKPQNLFVTSQLGKRVLNYVFIHHQTETVEIDITSWYYLTATDWNSAANKIWKYELHVF